MTTTLTAGFRGGEGEPLLLIHGAEASWHVWEPVLGALTERFDVHAPTMPGHPGGPALTEHPSFEVFTDFIEGYLDEHGLDRVHVAGNSLGGIVAMEVVRRGRARSAVSLAGPAALAGEREITRLMRLFTLGKVLGSIPLLPRLGELGPRFRKALLAGNMVHGERVTLEQFRIAMEVSRTSDTIALNLVRNYRDGHRNPPLDPGDVPVIVAWGDHDAAVPLEGYGRPSAALVRGAELRILADAGHVPMWDDPDGVVRAICDAADRVGSSASAP